MTTRDGARLVNRARFEGAALRFEMDGGIELTLPARFPETLLAELKQHRDVVAAALREEAEEETALRRWFPNFGTPVRDRETGRCGRLWGATKRGLIVDFGPGAPLLTLDPRSIVAE